MSVIFPSFSINLNIDEGRVIVSKPIASNQIVSNGTLYVGGVEGPNLLEQFWIPIKYSFIGDIKAVFFNTIE